MQSLKENSTLEADVKAEVDNQTIISGHKKSQTTTKADLKLHAVSDFDPGYNSLDSDGGSPISSTKKPNMKVSDITKKEINSNTDLSEVIQVKESSPKSEQSIEQNLLDKIRRRADSIGDNQSTPASFVHLHLDNNTETEPKTRIQPDKDASLDGSMKEEGRQTGKDAQLDGKVKEGSNNDINALANKMKTNLVLIPRGLKEKRDFEGMPSYPQYHQANLYASVDQINTIGSFTRHDGAPQPQKPKRMVHVPGGGVVRPGSNMKPPSQVGMMPSNIQMFPQPGMMMYQTQVPSIIRDYDVTGWPLQPDDFSNYQSHYTTTLKSGNSGTVIVKEEPPSPRQYSQCPGYESPEHKSKAISQIVDYLKNSDSQSESQSPPYSAPSSSHGSPYTPSFEQEIYAGGYPETPPPSVHDPSSPQSVMSCHSDDTMPVSPPQALSPPQMEPIPDDTTLAIMECEQEVNRLSIECLMEQDVEDKDTCLHVVVTQGRYSLAVAIAKRLSLSPVKGALDIQNNLGQTPVFLATVVNMPCLVSDLITLGADPSIKDRSGCTPLHYAAMKGFSTIVRSIHIGLQKTNRLQDFDVDLKDYEGKTPLHYAIEHHEKKETVFTAESQRATQLYVWNKDLISMLLFMGASTIGQDGKSGKTPLHYAVELHKLELIDLILEYDPDSACVNHQTFSGCTPLHLAVGLKTDESVIVDIVRKLMRKGADVSKENFEKEKPIALNPRKHVLVRNILSGRY